MKRGIKLAFAVLSLAAAGAAQAFNISAKSENPMITADGLRSATVQAAAGVAIPDDPNIKVTVFSRAIPSKIGQGQLIYLHRIELRRAFNGPTPPYPFAGWLPIETTERYGVGSDQEVRAELDHVLSEFFAKVKAIDPNVGIK